MNHDKPWIVMTDDGQYYTESFGGGSITSSKAAAMRFGSAGLAERKADRINSTTDIRCKVVDTRS